MSVAFDLPRDAHARRVSAPLTVDATMVAEAFDGIDSQTPTSELYRNSKPLRNFVKRLRDSTDPPPAMLPVRPVAHAVKEKNCLENVLSTRDVTPVWGVQGLARVQQPWRRSIQSRSPRGWSRQDG